jgi:hypothetical protein
MTNTFNRQNAKLSTVAACVDNNHGILKITCNGR